MDLQSGVETRGARHVGEALEQTLKAALSIALAIHNGVVMGFAHAMQADEPVIQTGFLYLSHLLL